MKTFNEEFEELKDWLRERDDAYLNTPWYGGLDGDENKKHSDDVEEYNRRLRELKQKYNVD